MDQLDSTCSAPPRCKPPPARLAPPTEEPECRTSREDWIFAGRQVVAVQKLHLKPKFETRKLHLKASKI
jgi:hypothetical protein